MELPSNAFHVGGPYEPIDACVGEPVVGEPAVEQKKGAKKRPRPKKVAPEIVGPGVVIFGDRFVCSYSGEFSKSAVFIPGVDSASFRNLPCAFAFLEESGAAPEIVQKYKTLILESYEQANTCERAPKRELLANFGGDRFYEEWIGPLVLWDQLTERVGLTVVQYNAKRKSGGITAHKRGAGANSRVTFEAAAYTIAYGKGPCGCRIINALDGGVAEEGEVDAKKTMSVVRALRKLSTFCNSHKDFDFKIAQSYGEGFFAFFVSAQGTSITTADKRYNNIAAHILGEEVYGPALVIFTRKYSQKI